MPVHVYNYTFVSTCIPLYIICTTVVLYIYTAVGICILMLKHMYCFWYKQTCTNVSTYILMLVPTY